MFLSIICFFNNSFTVGPTVRFECQINISESESELTNRFCSPYNLIPQMTVVEFKAVGDQYFFWMNCQNVHLYF